MTEKCEEVRVIGDPLGCIILASAISLMLGFPLAHVSMWLRDDSKPGFLHRCNATSY